MTMEATTEEFELAPIIIRAAFTPEGIPAGFYPSDVWPERYPANAVIISENQYREFIGHPGHRKWENGEVTEYTPPSLAPTVADYRAAIQSMIDAKAQEKQYDSGAILASYVNSTVAEWASQAQAFVAWRDAVWVYAFAELEKVQSGERDQPTIGEFLSELPVFDWAEAGS